jgi:hypothetical protein
MAEPDQALDGGANDEEGQDNGESERLREGRAALVHDLESARERIVALDGEAAALRQQLDDAASREQQAAARYRELMLRAEPSLPAEMIAGDSLDAIDASVVAARDVVGRVRSHIEAQSASAQVPAGAPQRSVPDTSTLSPQQKIRYGLEQRSQSA